MEKYVIDLDDFCQENMDWDKLLSLKEKIPNLKLNLFTIPGLCEWMWLQRMRDIDWIQMIPHGWKHPTSRECQNWTMAECEDYLDLMDETGWIHGFKAPGWQINKNMYQALWEREWWVADHIDYGIDRPQDLTVYLLDSPNKIHGHIGQWRGQNANSLEYIYGQLANLQGEFLFITELCRPTLSSHLTIN